MSTAKGFQRLNPAENAVIGVAAGVIEVVSLQPILYWKNASQQGLPFTLNPRLLYRGLSMSVVNMAILTGLQFPLTGFVTNLITAGQPRKLSDAETVLAALTGGIISGFACGPMELVMIQQQRYGGSLFAVPAQISREYGAMALFRGTSMACGREGLYTAGVLGLCPVLSEKLQARGLSVPQAKLGAAIGAGLVAASFSHPMDTVKSCVQGDVAQKEFKSVPETFGQLYKQAGFTRFFTGWSYRTGRMILAVGIMNECKLRFSPLFFPHHFRDG